MGSELVTDSQSPKRGTSENGNAPFSYAKVFDEQLPFYLAIGMSYSDYWDGDVEMVIGYRKSHELKRKWENQRMWLMGAYVYEAIVDVAPVLIPFAKDAKISPYRSEPIPLTAEEMMEQKNNRERLEAEENMEKMRAFMKRQKKVVSDNV